MLHKNRRNFRMYNNTPVYDYEELFEADGRQRISE